jgi:hypothetical protein
VLFGFLVGLPSGDEFLLGGVHIIFNEKCGLLLNCCTHVERPSAEFNVTTTIVNTGLLETCDLSKMPANAVKAEANRVSARLDFGRFRPATDSCGCATRIALGDFDFESRALTQVVVVIVW